MKAKIECNGYIVEGTAERWLGDLWIGSCSIKRQEGGKQIRYLKDIVFRESRENACHAALVLGMECVEKALPRVIG